MDKLAILTYLDDGIAYYRERSGEVFYVREEYLDRGRRRGAIDYQLEIRDQAPGAASDDDLAVPLEDVRVGVRFAAFTGLDPLRRRRRYVAVSGATVVARLTRLRELVERDRVQPPGTYSGRPHSTLKVAAFARFSIQDPEVDDEA